MGIATRVNGVAPPEVPLSDIDLGSLEFWLEDDDVRDGAFATLRREAPISFWGEPTTPGFAKGPGHWAVTKFDDVHFASRHPRHLQLVSQHRAQRPPTRGRGVLRIDDRARRPAASAATQHRQQSVHAEGGRPYRGIGARPRTSARRRNDHRASRRQRGTGVRACRTTAAAGHLRHDRHSRAGPGEDLSLDERDPRCQRSRRHRRCRGIRQGVNGLRRVFDSHGRGPAGRSTRRLDHQPGAGRGRRRAVDVGRDRLVLHPACRLRETRPPATRSATACWR